MTRSGSRLSPGSNSSSGAALVGLAILGLGLSMVLGVMPHEDRIVGAGLTVFGAALLVARGRLPKVPLLPAWSALALGLASVGLVLGYQVVFRTRYDVPKVAILLVGTLVVACAPFLARVVPLPGRRGRGAPLGTLLVCLLAILGAPLAAWASQAAFRSLMGSTPIESFVAVALIPPVGALMWTLGLDPSFSGQTITYLTPRGPLSVNVGAACSGVQAMALFGAVLAIFIVAERPAGRRMALWSIVGILGVYVANILRITTLMVVGYGWGPRALEQVHAQAGWVFFVAWALLFAWLARTPAGRGKLHAGVGEPVPR